MLLKSKISQHQLSLDPLLNEDYDKAKLGKFTSSEWYHLMAKEGIGKGGYSYIYRKVGEVLSGRKSKDNVSATATDHGLDYEREGLMKFGEMMKFDGVKMLVQRLVLDEDERCGGTPDGLIILNDSIDGLSHNVQSVEIKCPYSFDGYIRAWQCKTPADLKKLKPDWYWQKLHQMALCDCLDGYFVVYQPYFSKGQMNVIKFNKVEIVQTTTTKEKSNDFKLINERKKEAIQIFNDTLNELKND